MKGAECNPIEGSLYAFPSITLPEKFCQEAAEKGDKPDLYYCTMVLQKCGVVIVPGSGFRQKEGTWHFRTTILPLPESTFEAAFESLTKVNNDIMDKYQ